MSRSVEVSDRDMAGLRALADALAARLVEGGGQVLTAPQVGVPLRVIALRNGTRIEILVNPRITRHGLVIEDVEVCRSGLSQLSKRAVVVDFEARSIDGAELFGRCSGSCARALQHGLDHLDGALPNDEKPCP